MSVHYLTYRLPKVGHIDHWLLAGPQAIELPAGEPAEEKDSGLQIAHRFYETESGVTQRPQEWDPPLTIGGEALHWTYTRCAEDHLIDLSRSLPAPHYLRAWAYAEIECPQAQQVTLTLTTHGPADLWLNAQHLHRQEHLVAHEPRSNSFPGSLRKGRNQVLVRFEQVALPHAPYAMGLRVEGLPAGGVGVLLPTPVAALARRQTLERVIEAAYLDRDLYSGSEEVLLRWPDDLASAKVAARFQDRKGGIRREAYPTAQGSGSVALLSAFEAPNGLFQVLVLPEPKEYYEGNQRVTKAIDLTILNSRYSAAPYTTYEYRRQEAFVHAIRRGRGVFPQVAAMEAGRWVEVEAPLLLRAIEGVSHRRSGSTVELAGLLGMAYRYLDEPSFPQEVGEPLAACILGQPYGQDRPEGGYLLRQTCELLAAQLYPERTFAVSGQPGQWHCERAERELLAYLGERAAHAEEWTGDTALTEAIVALSHLADLAETPALWDAALVALDRTLCALATNSLQGAYCATRATAEAGSVVSARLQPVAAVSRLLWGMGCFNSHVPAVVSLACARRCGLPASIARAAGAPAAAEWRRLPYVAGQREVAEATYRTAEYALSSVQDYRPGQAGDAEHIWQATLGADAIVFVNHPACIGQAEARRPGFWRGNGALPRVAQWRDTLIALHRLPDGDRLGFTHAYFPSHAFDEHARRGGWAFARKGDAYLALMASEKMDLVEQGSGAWRELRAYGGSVVWLCQMGRAAEDGSFVAFQERVLGSAPAFDGLSVRWTTLRGDALALAWEGPFEVNGRTRPD